MPSNRLPSVAGRSYCAEIRRSSQNQNGVAMLLPSALYLGESAALCFFPFVSTQSPRSVHPSGKFWSLSHSSQRGVSRLTAICLLILLPPPPQNNLLIVHTVQRTDPVLKLNLMHLSIAYRIIHNQSPAYRCMHPVRCSFPDDRPDSKLRSSSDRTTNITPL